MPWGLRRVWLRRPRRHFLLDAALGRLFGHVQVVAALEVDPELRGGVEIAGEDPFEGDD